MRGWASRPPERVRSLTGSRDGTCASWKERKKKQKTPAYSVRQTPRRRGGAPLSSPPPTTDRRGTGWPGNHETPPIDERPGPPRPRPQRRVSPATPPSQVVARGGGPWGGAPAGGPATPPPPARPTQISQLAAARGARVAGARRPRRGARWTGVGRDGGRPAAPPAARHAAHREWPAAGAGGGGSSWQQRAGGGGGPPGPPRRISHGPTRRRQGIVCRADSIRAKSRRATRRHKEQVGGPTCQTHGRLDTPPRRPPHPGRLAHPTVNRSADPWRTPPAGARSRFHRPARGGGGPTAWRGSRGRMGGAAATAPCTHVGGQDAARRAERGVERPPPPGGSRDTSAPAAEAEAGRRQAWRERNMLSPRTRKKGVWSGRIIPARTALGAWNVCNSWHRLPRRASSECVPDVSCCATDGDGRLLRGCQRSPMRNRTQVVHTRWYSRSRS